MSNLKRPHFLQMFRPDLNSERLKIPERFARHIEVGLSGPFSLIGPSGNCWHVELVRSSDGSFLDDGWPTFVSDHFMQSGDSFVFRYNGNLNFSVQIFDASGCEAEFSVCAKCSHDCSSLNNIVGQKRERDTETSSHELFNGAAKKVRGHSDKILPLRSVYGREVKEGLFEKERCPLEVVVTSKTHGEAKLSNGTEKFCATMKDPLTRTISSDERPERTNCKRASIGGLPVSVARSFISKTLSVKKEERAAQAFNSSFPSFVKVMKKFNVSGSSTLNVPYRFSMANLPKSKTEIVLRNLEGQCWTVNSLPTTKVQTFHTFCGGWIGFVRGNHIKEGDTCIFELVGKSEMRVHIFGAGEEAMDSKPQNETLKELIVWDAATTDDTCNKPEKEIGSSKQGNLTSTIKAIVSDKKQCDHDEIIKKIQPPASYRAKKKRHCASKRSIGSGLSSLLKSCSENPATQGKIDTEDELGGNARGRMSMRSTPEEKRVFQSFESSFPYFIKVMKKFNVSGSYTLRVPYQFCMEHLPNCKTKVSLRNLKGKCWIVNSVPTKGQIAHTFCGGWMAFICGNDVKMGDVCVFELIGKCEMQVQILRDENLSVQNESHEPLQLAKLPSSHPS